MEQSQYTLLPIYTATPRYETRWNNDDLKLSQRLRRWSNIKTPLFQRVVFAGI